MADELLSVLTRFHRDVVLPDLERVVDSRIQPLRDEMLTYFDGFSQKLGRLENEYQALSAATERLEQNVSAIEKKIDRMALRSEAADLRSKIASLEQRLTRIEGDL